MMGGRASQEAYLAQRQNPRPPYMQVSIKVRSYQWMFYLIV